jgi:uncharacterized repeat protein (TIGR01451 family)
VVLLFLAVVSLPLGLASAAPARPLQEVETDLVMETTADVERVGKGAEFTYSLTVRNEGTADAVNLTLTDELPDGVTLQSATPSAGGTCLESDGTVTCSFTELLAGQLAEVELLVTAPDADVVVENTARAFAVLPFDPRPENNISTAATIVGSPGVADLALTQSGERYVGVGTPYEYRIDVSNTGPRPTAGVTVTDVLPAAMKFVSASAGCDYVAGSHTVICAVGGVGVNEVATVLITVEPTAQGTFVNTARAEHGPGGPSAVAFSQRGNIFANVLVRNNSFRDSAGINWSTDRSGGFVNAHSVGNIVGVSECHPDVSYSHNVFDWATCSATDKTVTSFGYVNQAGGDYHLGPVSRAINAVSPSDAPPRDIDRQARPVDGASDAGADEFGGSPPPPPEPDPADLYVAPDGSDADLCTQTQPCRSFDRAFDLAAPGDTVELAAGIYPAQVLTGQKAAPKVTFQAADAVTVNGGLEFGSCVTCGDGPSNVRVEDVIVNGGVAAYNPARFIDLVRIDARSFYLNSVQDVLVKDGDWGPSLTGDDNSKIDLSGGTGYQPNERITIDGAYFHDYRVDSPTDHFECLIIFSGTDITVRNSRFRNCEYYDIFLQHISSDRPLSDITIENNFFDRPWNGQGAQVRTTGIEFAPVRNTFSNVTIRNNSFREETGISWSRDSEFTNTKVVGNLIGRSDFCPAGVSYSYNVTTGITCSPSDRAVSTFAYVDEAGGDYHLTPLSEAINAGDPADFAATDIDGDARSGTPDAGADEFGGSPPPPPEPDPADLYVAPDGSDADLCTQTQPCRSFDRAFDLAAPGGTVELAAGIYPAQVLTGQKAAPKVTFQAADAVTVNGGLEFGSCVTCGDGPSNVRVEDVIVNGGVAAYSPTRRLQLVRIDARNFYLRGVQDVLVKGGDWGPSLSGEWSSKIDLADEAGQANYNITIDGAVFHDYRIADATEQLPTEQFECLSVVSGIGITVRNSKFYNCEFHDIFLEHISSDRPLSDITIENNFFDTPWNGAQVRESDPISHNDAGSLETSVLPAAPPSVSVADVAPIAEWNSGMVPAEFTVSLSWPTAARVAVEWQTMNGTAQAESDFTGAGGTLLFEPGETTRTIAVSVNGDMFDEANETFFVHLSGADNAAVADDHAQATIVDDDPRPRIRITNTKLLEPDSGTKGAVFYVRLSRASGRLVRVSFATLDGTAHAREDYLSKRGRLTFLPGVARMKIVVAVRGDHVRGPNETFYVKLSKPLNAVIADRIGRGIIRNDD